MIIDNGERVIAKGVGFIHDSVTIEIKKDDFEKINNLYENKE